MGAPYPIPTGICLWFTGLSGAGKSTSAERLAREIRDRGRIVTLLDGDAVRQHLSSGLGYSRADRDTNVRRIGYVASEIVRHGGVVICAAVSPYRATRDEVRTMVGNAHFVEVFVDTPLAECERRDVKGLYAQARAGAVAQFTGLDDPYEPPLSPEITLDTVAHSVEENTQLILDFLTARGVLLPDHSTSHPSATAPARA